MCGVDIKRCFLKSWLQTVNLLNVVVYRWICGSLDDAFHTMDTLMVNGINVQTQLSSIMDVLAKTAVAEIGKVINECALILRLEISQRTSENDSLRKRCELLENQLRAVRSNGGGGGVQMQKTPVTSACNGAEFFGEVRTMTGRL